MSFVPLEVMAINFSARVIHLTRNDSSPTELPEALADFRAEASVMDGGELKYLFEMHDIIKETGELQKGWKCLT